MLPGIGFALLHIISTAVVWSWVRKRLSQSGPAAGSGNEQPTLVPAWPFLLCFLVAGAVMVHRRATLSRDFNDFLDTGAAPEYETYFFLASAPVMSILLAKGLKGPALIVATASILVAYFNGIRYYMFPFIGYFVWLQIIKGYKQTRFARLFAILIALAIGWLGLTYWGILRGTNMRGNPIEAAKTLDRQAVLQTLIQGNEFVARLAYYDLSARLYTDRQIPLRIGDETLATFGSMVYPLLLRPFGWTPPISNSKAIYEIQTGIIGTGVSTGSLPFGTDWLSWGSLGCIFGGALMGIILAGFDETFKRGGVLWLLIGPLSAYQLVFLARGGTDVWLGLWGRVMPLSIMLMALARVFSAMENTQQGTKRALSCNETSV
jgi:hypothetical protein